MANYALFMLAATVFVISGISFFGFYRMRFTY